jgi:hypothetical protein
MGDAEGIRQPIEDGLHSWYFHHIRFAKPG